MLDANVALVHKDFAKSKGWQSVFFGLGCLGFLAVLSMVFGESVLVFVQAGFVAVLLGVGSVIGLDVKKMRELLKELPKPEEGDK